jgi:cobaltochelatase CobT
MTGEISVMRRGLERALMAKLTRDWNRGQEAGRLDTRRLVGALAGRPNVFKTPAERGEIDTAVSILVDLSGSMAKMDRDGPARDATIGLVEAMVKAGVSVEVVGMSMESYDEDGAATAWRTSGGRWEPLDLLVFKAFEDRLFEAKPALVAIGAACHRYCNNCDGETLMLTYDRLRRRPERKKVLFVLSDGEPVCEPYVHTRREVLDKHLKDSIAYVEAQGVEVVGVGIQSQSVRKFYPRHMVIDDLGDLAKQTMGLLGKLLLERPGRRSA